MKTNQKEQNRKDVNQIVAIAFCFIISMCCMLFVFVFPEYSIVSILLAGIVFISTLVVWYLDDNQN